MEAIDSKPLTIAVGQPHRKTYLAISAAVRGPEAGTVSRIVLSRPPSKRVKTSDSAGDMREKLDPYLRPLWDALNDRLGASDQPHRVLA